MIDATLKASLKQTLAYINAYDVQLLRAIEHDFKAALQNLHAEDEFEDVQTKRSAEVNQPPEITLSPPVPLSRHHSKSFSQIPAYQVELIALPNWHFQLPFFTAAVAVILLLITR